MAEDEQAGAPDDPFREDAPEVEGTSSKFNDQWFSKMQEKFDKEKANIGKAFVTYPDGFYLGKLTSAKLADNKNGDPMVTWAYVIGEGEYAGERVLDFDTLTRENAFKWLGEKMAKFGVDLAQIGALANLPDVLNDLAGSEPEVKFKLKTNAGKGANASQKYQNFYLEKVFTESGSSSSDAGVGTFELKKGLAVEYSPNGSTSRTTGIIASFNDMSESAIIRDVDGSTTEVEYKHIIGPAR